MVNPASEKGPTYVADLTTAAKPFKSSTSRMVVIAAQGADGDAATAAMADGRLFTSDASRLHVDLIRIPDQVEFMLCAGLVSWPTRRGSQAGMTLLKTQADGSLGRLGDGRRSPRPLLCTRGGTTYRP
ncbi:hypothetical protein AB0A95_10540 [Micromonospora sp. NPDC049230]|uniref:hypothetical protein n=1 Tax=Micromonospora sp. NPDC049230 TaxID=3155502 RepID=UPI0033FB50C4